MKKMLLLPFVALVVLIFATMSIVRTQPTRETFDPPSPPPRATFKERVAAVGLVEAKSENISIASHLPGVVDKVLVTVGQEVKAGDPLVKLDTRALEAMLAERRAELSNRQAAAVTAQARKRRAQATLDEAQRNLKFAESVSDARSISAEEMVRRRSAVEINEADMQAAEADVTAAQAGIIAAEAALKSVEVDLQRSTVTAPINGQVLQVRIRPGEFATAGASASPWLVIGDVSTLHVRVDIDEHETWRVRPNAPAVTQVRGNADISSPAKFVRFEPLVVPKQSLTGASTERVDTRVLQAIYAIERKDLPLFVGQQMDVFIDATGVESAAAK